MNKIIIAMDNEIEEGIELIESTVGREEIYGYKIGSLWLLEELLAPEIKGKVFRDLKDALRETDKKIILDMQKWSTDIPDIVTKQVAKVAPYIDELIACPMGAGSDSLKAFANTCHENSIKPICVLEMTHTNSSKYLSPENRALIIEDCYNFGIKNFVLPATKNADNILKSLIEFYFGKEKVELYATGFKTQGGQTKPMRDFGVTKFIVGRAIYEAEDPIKAIADIYEDING